MLHLKSPTCEGPATSSSDHRILERMSKADFVLWPLMQALLPGLLCKASLAFWLMYSAFTLAVSGLAVGVLARELFRIRKNGEAVQSKITKTADVLTDV